jgi:hypothetical protein
MTKAAAAVAADPKLGDLPRFAPLLRHRWRARESGVLWNEHEIVPEAGTPFERVLEADYWANIAAKMRAGDTLIVMPDDGAWRAELLVWDVGHNYAQVSQVWKAERPQFAAAPGLSEDDFEVSFAGPIKKWRVIRKSDRAELKDGLPTRPSAEGWRDDHRKALRS